MKNQILLNDIKGFCESIGIEYPINFVKDYAEIGDSEYYGGKHCGSDAEHEGARFIAKKLEEIGVPEIELVETPTTRYQFNDAEITVVTEVDEQMEIKPFGFVSPGTDKGGITAELIDTGESTKDFYVDNSAEGKIALMQGMGVLDGTNLSAQMEEAVIHGAKAIIIFMTEDMLDEDTIRMQPPNIDSKIPMVSISKRHAEYLKRLLSQNEKVEINLKVDADYIPNGGTTYNVVSRIPGTISDEQIIYTAHLDHFFRCLQDNMASCAALLGIAKAIIDSGYKPKRSIMFVFHGSHECGMADSRYAYISGSYKLTHNVKTEWKGKTIADINFEYAALALDELRVITSVGNDSCLRGYFKYAPELVGGYKTIREDIIMSEYYLLSWGDVIAYNTAGIPVYNNDIITEQMTTGNSPYVGRDHSNKDNWDSFNNDALADTIRFYGSFGLYLDSMPYLEMNFAKQAERMQVETNFEFLETIGIDTEPMKKAISELDTVSTALYEKLKELNSDYIRSLAIGMSDDEVASYYVKNRNINKSLLALFDLFQSKLEKIGPPDFLYIGNQKYSENIRIMSDAIGYLEKGLPKEALEECLKVDICAISYYFSKEVANHISKQISSEEYADRRTWARGKELSCLNLYTLIQLLKVRQCEVHANFDEEIAILQSAIDSEKVNLIDILKEEKECLSQATLDMYKLMGEINSSDCI